MNIKQIQEDGYLFMKELEPEASSTAVISSLGVPLALGEGPAIHTIAPAKRENSTPNTYSGIYGLGAFPFHTDLAHWRYPPRYLVLRCVVGFEDVPTLLLDGDEIASAIGRPLLSRSLVRPRRPVDGRLPLYRLLQPSDQRDVLRWDQVFIQPASEVGRTGVEKFRACIDALAPIHVALSRPGDTLVIDNWRMLHARAAVGPEHQSRTIERTYLGDVF